jgi:hypothetical protein
MPKQRTRFEQAYKAAEEAGEMDGEVRLTGLVSHINDNIADADLAPVLKSAKAKLHCHRSGSA